MVPADNTFEGLMPKSVSKSGGAADDQKMTPYDKSEAFAAEVQESKAKADAVKAAGGRAVEALDAVLSLERVCQQGMITFFRSWSKFNEKLCTIPEGDVRITLPMMRKALLPPLFVGHTKMAPFVRGDQMILQSAELMIKINNGNKDKPVT
jgi:hypothetical protein